MARPRDRRDSARYSTVLNQAVLAWRDGADSSQVNVVVNDVSHSGASLYAKRLPAVPAAVWVRLEEPRRTGWAEAVVIGKRKVVQPFWLWGRVYSIRVRFVEACPYDFFLVATHGCSLDEKGPEMCPGGLSPRDWR